MRCIERRRAGRTGLTPAAGGTAPPPPRGASEPAISDGREPVASDGALHTAPPGEAASAAVSPETGAAAASRDLQSLPDRIAAAPLAAPTHSRDRDQSGLQAAVLLPPATSDQAGTSAVPEVLPAIVMLHVERDGDGGIRDRAMLRPPRHAKDTVALATTALHRGARYGKVSHLPKPWRFPKPSCSPTSVASCRVRSTEDAFGPHLNLGTIGPCSSTSPPC